MKKNKKWTRARHKVARAVLLPFIHPYSKLKYGVDARRFKEQGNRKYLILYNHQTAFDQFFIARSFKGAVYHVATEDIFSMGFVSDIIRFLVAPIPIKKQANDVGAVLNCLRVAREGATIAIAPEGNRTYSGCTEFINPTIAMLAKRLKLPIALYRIEGGYGVHPRWSDVTRKGKMVARVARVLEPEEYLNLSDEELNELIRNALYVDETLIEGEYNSNKRAEYLERAIYVCPYCNLSEFESNGNEIRCKKCNRRILYNKDKTLSGIGFEFPFKSVKDWYSFQNDYVANLDLTNHLEKPIYSETADLFEVIVYKNKNLLQKSIRIQLFGDKIVLGENSDGSIVLPFDKLSAVSVLGKNKLNLYYGDKIFQLKGDKRFNALKYVNIYYRSRNIKKGEADGKFLGI